MKTFPGWDLLEGWQIDPKKAMAFGFVKTDGMLVFEKPIGSGLLIKMTSDGRSLRADCIDEESRERFVPLYVPGSKGTYVDQVRKDYLQTLLLIRNACCVQGNYQLAQSKRIIALVQDQMKISIDHLFAKDPSIGVFHHDDGRWFAFLSPVMRSKVFPDGDDTTTEVLVFRSDDKENLLKQAGFGRAWHMNQQRWVSLEMNDTVNDADVLSLLEQAGVLVGGPACHAWLLPANPKQFDVIAALQNTDTITWHKDANVLVHDRVYLYYARPYGCILYQFEVIGVDDKEMVLQVRERYARGQIDLAFLKEIGLRAPRSLRHLPSDQEKKVLGHAALWKIS
ncbi:MAG: MmcQ/YjbR family DNA-binding protein [Lactimicrobium sp.]|jgi:predicted DNA-binding protein (MmcQ/YjbR family)|uniref:MmcQ/YjbR family DNA-binding protein n=1 Tax=Lactimicrobium sp. TaxID=2563780 RepID=UPI002F35180D